MSSVWVGKRGTIKDYPGFNASEDAKAIHQAIKGLGTNEKALIEILPARSNAQRQLIAKEYKEVSKKELKAALDDDLTGNLERIMVALVTPPAVFDAKQLRRSMRGTGTDEKALAEILASRTNEQLKEIAEAYSTAYKTTLVNDISSETSGDVQKALIALASGKRDEKQKADQEVAKKDAQILYHAGEKRWGTDEDKFIEVLCYSSFPQLKLTFDEYKNISGKTIEDSIQSETSGGFEDLLLAIVKCATNTPAFFAERLHEALEGIGTDDSTLTRILASRSEIDLLDIQEEYEKMYGHSLRYAIKSESAGYYEKTLLRIIGGEDEEEKQKEERKKEKEKEKEEKKKEKEEKKKEKEEKKKEKD